MKRFLALLVTVCLLLSVVACSKNDNKASDSEYIAKNEDSVELGTPTVTLNPDDVYKSITYTPEMFYGSYRVRGGDAADDKYAETAEFAECNLQGDTRTLTTLPVGFCAGPNNLQHKISWADGYNWAKVTFMRKLNTGEFVIDYFYCAYEIAGTKLTVKPLDDFQVDDESKKITLDFSDIVWTYDFSFKGRTLTLSDGKNSIDLDGALDPYGEHDYFYTEAFLSAGSKRIEDFFKMEFMYDAENGYKRFVIAGDSNSNNHGGIAKIEENGLFTFTVPVGETNKTYQYVYFYNHYDGLILTDGTDVFFYNLNYSGYHRQEISKYVSEEQEGLLDTMDEETIKKIAERKEGLLEELMSAFEAENIKVKIDNENGELAIDSSVLFGGDSAELSAEGKAFLDKFVSVYTSIIFSEKYKDFISKTFVEGHTALLQGSTYESGLALSQERADAVKAYCLSVKTDEDKSMPETALEAVGLSNSIPITDAKGNVNLEASRRVSFKFVINVQ